MTMSIDLTVSLSRADKARSPYFYVPVDVPAGTTRLDVSMAYPKADDCVIDLGLFDTGFAPYPATTGFRGWSGGARDTLFVATDDATPGYLPGPVPAGTWRIVLGLYRLPAEPVQVHLAVSLDRSARPTITPPPRSTVSRPGAGWYRGDLQSHCHHSDAAGGPELLHASARAAGLDFLAVTDHNTISQRRYFNPASSPELIFVRGIEVTTEFGHANVFGTDEWIDFRFEQPGDPAIMAARVRELGGVLSINHDKPTIEWQWPRPETACMEVWQSAWPALNAISLAKYQGLLATGRRITAIGGSDYHQPATLEADNPLFLGRPTTVMHLEELSEAAILGALRSGYGYVTESPKGPHLELTASGRPMGSFVPRTQSVEVTVRGAVGDELHLIDATGEIMRLPITDADWRQEVPIEAAGFVRAEILAIDSRERILAASLAALPELEGHPSLLDIANGPLRRAISNPIYFAEA